MRHLEREKRKRTKLYPKAERSGLPLFLAPIYQTGLLTDHVTANLGVMKVTSDHKIQIFCAALSAIIQADAKISVAYRPNPGSKTGVPTAVERAIRITERRHCTTSGR